MNNKNQEPQEIPFVIPSGLSRIYATGAFGGYTAQDFRILLYSEEPLEQDTILNQKDLGLVREVQGEVILAPLAAKQLADWLLKQVKDYEKNIGEIPFPKEISDESTEKEE